MRAHPTTADAWLELPEGRVHPIGRGCVLGRMGSCEVVLSDEGVSRRHAQIAPAARGGHAISDLGSTNGTFVNGLRIAEPTVLRDRDVIGLGTCELKFRTHVAVAELVTQVNAPGGAPLRRSVLVAAEASLLGDGLQRLIESQPGWMVAGQSGDPRQVRQLQTRLQPDVILLDASADGVGAFSLLADLLAANAEARVAAVLARPDPDFIHRLLAHGALACVLRADPADELMRALQSACAGSVYLSRRVASVAVRQLAGSKEAGRRDGPLGLTDRELEIFHLVGGARANREIAAALGMSVKTVETHKENIKIKLGLATAAELSEQARAWVAK